MNRSKSQQNVLWLQVWGLAAVQGAIALTWVIYAAYVPQLLGEFGFPKQLAAGLLVVENALAVVLEPLMGGLSDKAYHWVGSKFSFISVGVILSSALFVAIPAVAIFGTPAAAISWILPGVIVAWALAMTVFRSPAVSLLGRYAAPAELPLAASLLTVVGGLIGAFKPVTNQILLSWKPSIVFAIGSFALLGATAVLRYVQIPTRVEEGESEIGGEERSENHHSLLPALGLILGTGAAVAWGTRFLIDTVAKVLKTQMGTTKIDWLLVGVSIALAVAALPAGAIAVRLGNRRAMLVGIGATVGLLLAIAFSPNLTILGVTVIVISVFFSLIVNGAIPFALSLVPPQRAGLGIGMYFGGFSAAMSLFGVVFQQLEGIPATTGAIVGAIAFLLAGICIAASIKMYPHEPQ